MPVSILGPEVKIHMDICNQKRWKPGSHANFDALASDPLSVDFINPL